MRTWLVTGGCGFIGSHLAHSCIAAGDRVIVLDDMSNGHLENLPAGAELARGNICDRNTVQALMQRVDGCFHLAAIPSVERSNEDWPGTHRVNLSGAIEIFDAAHRARAGRPIRVVYASSAAVYGDCDDIPLGEDAPTKPLTAYGADKLGCELHARVAYLVHGVPNVGLRFFNVYGPRQDPRSPYSGVIAIFARIVSEGGTPTIFGDGQQLRDFIYVDDIVAMLRAAMATSDVEYGVFNACTGLGTTVEELARLVFRTQGRPPKLAYGPGRTGDIRRSLGNPSKLKTALGIGANVALADGMKLTLSSLAADFTSPSRDSVA